MITASMVKELRTRTGAGMMDCKKALVECDGDVEKAIEDLRKKGASSVAKRAGRTAKEGIIASYIHPGDKLGVLVEVNCETDFVARTEAFREFARNIAMQIAAADPLVVRRDEISEEMLEKEKNVYRGKAQNEGKPEHILDRIVEGRLQKYYQEVCLLEQTFVKDADQTIQEVLTKIGASLGENIGIKRFARFRLGEEE
ncbi:MAG: translation elongation factor Ts [Candidatus Latescibacteria bacterium]|nr:translation elongation factor Ts [Candidatus Latescibacterota bacterium]MCK5329204.1 translation elongation factor Ts [Candidatus Latescibacterota bacterium]MCK5380109.1 translation elongation factor Ts [Candidatus Latescibacterota bacterium]MCK5527102.1 translation elongation factor Ts [Candidatus Latescibacterota bacterium]MCK5733798.1 translation elongation factor Ts [Candidatus Latescibacterota bacterium]